MSFKVGDIVLTPVTLNGVKKPARITRLLPNGWHMIRFINDGETHLPTTALGQIGGWERHESQLELVERPVKKFVYIRKVNGEYEEV